MEYKKENYKGCIVVQGKTHPDFLPLIKEKWNGYLLIFSTWKGDESHYTDDDIVLFSEMPDTAGTSNLNLQKITTWNGLALARRMGWEYALKWRSDMYPTNADLLWSTFSNDGLNFLVWTDWNGGYVTDYFMYGSCDDITTLFDIEPTHSGFPEQHITKRLKESGLAENAKCMGNQLSEENDICWMKNGIMLSSYKGNGVYKYEIPKS